MKNKLILIVEGKSDKIIIESIFKAVGLSDKFVSVLISEGKHNMKDYLSNIPASNNTIVGILMDLDIINLPDAKNYIETKQEEYGDVEVFFAVPEIEAWLFADDELAIKNGKSKSAQIILERLPLPDEIPHPKQSAYNLLKNYKSPHFLENINISKATARSSSLYNFLSRVGEILKTSIKELETPISKNLDRRVFINLLNEHIPSNKIIFKASDGSTYRVIDMIKHIKNETEVGKEYTSDLLRIARDLLIRKANAPA